MLFDWFVDNKLGLGGDKAKSISCGSKHKIKN